MTAKSLCLTCGGLCCDGTLFSRLPITPAEAERLGPTAPALPRRLPIYEDAGRLFLDLPCPAHEGPCAIHPDRPQNCREFRCAPLDAVESGAMSHDDAASILARAKALSASVRERLGARGALWRDVESASLDSPEWRRENGDLVLDLAVLREMLRRIRHGPTPGR